MVAEHFAGRVDRYSIWNEPNWRTWLGPLKSAPGLYRSLYTRGYDAIKKADPRAKVLIGETSPYERPGLSTAPIAFLRKVACVNSKYKRVGSLHAAEGGRIRPPPVRLPARAQLPVPGRGQRDDRDAEPADEGARQAVARRGAAHQRRRPHAALPDRVRLLRQRSPRAAGEDALALPPAGVFDRPEEPAGQEPAAVPAGVAAGPLGLGVLQPGAALDERQALPAVRCAAALVRREPRQGQAARLADRTAGGAGPTRSIERRARRRARAPAASPALPRRGGRGRAGARPGPARRGGHGPAARQGRRRRRDPARGGPLPRAVRRARRAVLAQRPPRPGARGGRRRRAPGPGRHAGRRGARAARPGRADRAVDALAGAVRRGAASGADQLSVGPVWETPTKAGRPAAGLDYVRYAAEHGGNAPWFAIGGIDGGNVGEVVAAGADGSWWCGRFATPTIPSAPPPVCARQCARPSRPGRARLPGPSCGAAAHRPHDHAAARAPGRSVAQDLRIPRVGPFSIGGYQTLQAQRRREAAAGGRA